MPENKYVTVSALNRYIFHKFDKDVHLQQVYLKGEISNFKASGKHFYFSLKDDKSEISAMMFFPDNLNIRFKPADGVNVQVVGQVRVYEKRGTYSILVKQMEEEGVGALYAAFLALKDKLQKEGLFDERHKKPIPEYPMEVGIVTAATGDAIHDIISTFNRRLPLARLTLYPALVQGTDAPKDLIRALKLAYSAKRHDVIIIGQGGGSFEDLNCFNDEELVRTLFASPVPIVTAIGHEADYTLCDYVASYRAPTPTGAAMRLTKDKNDVLNYVDSLVDRLTASINNKIELNNKQLHRLTDSYGLSNFSEVIKRIEQTFLRLNDNLHNNSPLVKVDNYLSSLRTLQERINNGINKILDLKEQKHLELKNRLRVNLITDQINQLESNCDAYVGRLNQLITNKIDSYDQRLEALNDKVYILNPINLMRKGYSIVYHQGEVLTKINKLKVKDQVDVKMADGMFSATVTFIEEEKENGK